MVPYRASLTWINVIENETNLFVTMTKVIFGLGSLTLFSAQSSSIAAKKIQKRIHSGVWVVENCRKHTLQLITFVLGHRLVFTLRNTITEEKYACRNLAPICLNKRWYGRLDVLPEIFNYLLSGLLDSAHCGIFCGILVPRIDDARHRRLLSSWSRVTNVGAW